jgi:hypothetical protein
MSPPTIWDLVNSGLVRLEPKKRPKPKPEPQFRITKADWDHYVEWKTRKNQEKQPRRRRR